MTEDGKVGLGVGATDGDSLPSLASEGIPNGQM